MWVGVGLFLVSRGDGHLGLSEEKMEFEEQIITSSVKAIVQYAFLLAQNYVASINAFPYLQERVKVG